MSFRNNGRKRDPKYMLSALFLLGVGTLCLVIAGMAGWKFTSTLIGAIICFLGLLMFKNANEQ